MAEPVAAPPVRRPWLRLRWLWLLLPALLVAVWLFRHRFALTDDGLTGYSPRGVLPDHGNYPVSKVVKDDRPTRRIDPGQPWRIEFGRGSGWHGLETVKLDQDGRVVLHRANSGQWATTTLQLSQDAVTRILEAVVANR